MRIEGKKRAKKKFRSPKAKLIFMNFLFSLLIYTELYVYVLWNMWRRTWKTKLLKKSPFTLINCIKFFIFLQADLHEAICTLRCVIVHHIIFFFWRKVKFLLSYGQLDLLWDIGMGTWEHFLWIFYGVSVVRK
jgi:hypothetical protein